jgi:phage FluMu protein Com
MKCPRCPEANNADYRSDQRYYKDRKKSWLNEIFD